MILFIHPEDDSTCFLSNVYNGVKDECGKDSCIVYNIKPNDGSYEECLAAIKECNEDCLIVFMGHGSSEILYGQFDDARDTFIEANRMGIFDDKNLLLLACDSASLLKGCFNRTNIRSSVGFEYLPTDMAELNVKKLRNIGVTDEMLSEFNNILVKTITQCLVNYTKFGASAEKLYSYIRLHLNKVILESVLESKKRELADLVYVVLSGSTHLSSNS